MNKEELLSLGVPEGVADAVLEAVHKEYVGSGNFIPKAKFDEVIQERNGLRDQLSEVNKSLKSLKEGAEGNDALRATIQKMQDEAKERDSRHRAEVEELRKRNAIMADIGGSAHNPEDVLRFVDLSKVSVRDDGTLDGWDAQKADLVKSKPYLFKDGEQARGPFANPANNPHNGDQGGKPSPDGFDPEAFAKSIAQDEARSKPYSPDTYFGGGDAK